MDRLGLLILFSKLQFNAFMTKVISILAPTAFGIYLFQDSNYFRKYIVAGQYAGYALNNALIMVGLILLTGLIQFMIGFVIDKCRGALFNAIRIRKLSNRVGSIIDTRVDKTVKWIEKVLDYRP